MSDKPRISAWAHKGQAVIMMHGGPGHKCALAGIDREQLKTLIRELRIIERELKEQKTPHDGGVKS
jgi:hypothetical protein